MDNQRGVQHSRREVLPAFIGTVAFAGILYAVMSTIQPTLVNNAFIPSFGEMLAGCMEGSALSQLQWFVADMSQSTFLASVPASILLIVGALIAAHLENIGSPLMGTGVDGNGHIYGRMTIASLISVGSGTLLFGRIFPGFTGWIPTFAVVLVVQPLITQFGASLPKLATCIVLSTLATFPVTYMIMNVVVSPLGVPLFVAVSLAVIVVAPTLAFICRALPWMKTTDVPAAPTSDSADATPAHVPSPTNFFINRVLGDVGELAITGSSISTALMYAGVIIGWAMNPFEPAYGAGNLPLLLASQLCCGALAVFIYYPQWKSGGFQFTFAGVVFTSAIVGGFAATGTPVDFIVAVPTIIIGAIVFVPLIGAIMKAFRFNGSYPAIALIQLAISPLVVVWALLLMHVILPMF